MSDRPGPAEAVRSALTIPAILESTDHAAEVCEGLRRRISDLRASKLRLDDPVEAFGNAPFFLAYYGCDARPLHEEIAAFYREACPGLAYAAPNRRGRGMVGKDAGRIRIGFVSRHFFNHSIAKLSAGLISNLPRDAFRVFLLRFPRRADRLADAVRRLGVPSHVEALEAIVRPVADEVVDLPRDLPAARERVAALDLDVLFYTDIGMEPLTYFLAFSRLAPVQCTTWGHPVTTGIPAIDYFLSSDDLEPEGAEAAYSEKLVRLPRAPTFYYRPCPAPGMKTRTDLGLETDRHIYLCPQSLFKLHPEFDDVVAGILRADDEALVVFIEGAGPANTAALRERLGKSIPDVADRVRFVPRRSQLAFLDLIRGSDVILDPVGFGGGVTTYEALSVAAPVVTLPGRFMRGRVAFAAYRGMGLPDLVAPDRDGYVRLAVEVGTDPAARESLRARIAQASDAIYEDQEAVGAVARFLVEAVDGCEDRLGSARG